MSSILEDNAQLSAQQMHHDAEVRVQQSIASWPRIHGSFVETNLCSGVGGPSADRGSRVIGKLGSL